jgi:hypothetical protein
MCNKCARKIGNAYIDSTMSRFRPVVDAARKAARPDGGAKMFAGLAVTKVGQTITFMGDVSSLPLAFENDATTVLSLMEKCPDATAFAFEALDNSWPDKALFRALKLTAPKITILRIHNGTGSI